MKVIGRAEWVHDVRFAKYVDRRENWASLMDGVEQWSRQVTTGQCLAALNAEGVPSSAYRSVAEALADPQLAHRKALAEVVDDGGSFRVMNQPFRMSGAAVTVAPRMSTLGEHTKAYLKQLGLSDAEIAAFADRPNAVRA
jgi:crotonobetainyl-CoA:carnitine CoA-transferase CaiB-like acyl-CoA transferase